MSFITESKKAYKQVKENHVAIAMGNMLDDEGSMILNQLEELERGINMLRDYVGKDYEKQLPAWVQSKVTLATDYISTVGNYLSSKNEKATEESIKESFSLEENTFEKIYKMQQDGKSTEDIAKELKLNPALVKKVLGENTIISEGLSDTQISQLKKEYEPLKGKTITTSQYQQLKNILFKLQDGDLEKLQKQNIPFASTGAGSILRARKSPVKITSVKVPGLEGLAEEPKNPYAIGMAAAMKATGDTPPLKKSTITKAHKIADKVKEEEVNKTNPKSDEKRTIDMTDGSAHVRFPKDDTKAMEFYKSKGYKVTTKYEETELEEACWTGYKKVGMKKKGDRMVPNCVPEGYVTESGDIVEFVELNEGQFKEIDTRKGDLKLAKDKKQNLKDKYNAIMAGQATGDENSIADQIQKLEMSIKKQEQELIDIMKKQRETKKEEVELQEKPSIKQYVVFHSDDSPTKHKDFKAYDETELNKQIGEFLKQNPGYKVYGKSPSQSIKELTSRNINEGARALVEAIAALQNKADKSGMPYSILKQVYDRGMAAWKGGHRPGAGQHQWAFARVNSFVTKSSGTWGGADSDLAKKVKGKE